MDEGKIVNLDLLVKDTIRTLTLPAKKFEHPVSIVLVGPPFSGKTTLVERLASHFPLVVVSELNLASFLAPRATFFKRGAEEVFLLATKTIAELTKEGYATIYDSSLKKRLDRQLVADLVTKAGGKYVLLELHVDQDEVHRRLQKINSQVARGDRKGFIMDKDLLHYELNSIERPTSLEHPIVYHVSSETVDNIISKLSPLFL